VRHDGLRPLLTAPKFSDQPDNGEYHGDDPEQVEKDTREGQGDFQDNPKNQQKNGE